MGAVVGLSLGLGVCSAWWAVARLKGQCATVCAGWAPVPLLFLARDRAAPLVSPRTLMGPYGMDRTVHCFDFYECANGLGECQGTAGRAGVPQTSLQSPEAGSGCASLCEVGCLIGSCVLYLPVSSTFCSCDIKRMSKSQLIPW